ncbi:CU044_2847 family protein [Streptomyces sp. TE33382]
MTTGLGGVDLARQALAAAREAVKKNGATRRKPKRRPDTRRRSAPTCSTRVSGGRLALFEGEMMQGMVRVPLEGGGSILFEGVQELEGPVKAGRVGDALQDVPGTLRESLAPVRETARTVLEELRQAGPEEVEVEFGVNVSAKAGAVIAKGDVAVHLKVRLTWKNGEPSEGAQ